MDCYAPHLKIQPKLLVQLNNKYTIMLITIHGHMNNLHILLIQLNFATTVHYLLIFILSNSSYKNAEPV